MSRLHFAALLAMACGVGAFTATGVAPITTRLFSEAPPQARKNSFLKELINPNSPMAWNTVIGEADRAFRLGMQLSKAGQPRGAANALHEAATLYSCFLELPSSFGHVTSLNREEECPSLLAFTLVRLAFLNLDALGDPKSAVRLYTMATQIDPLPSAVAYRGIGLSLEATGGNGEDASHLEEAVKNYQKALEIGSTKQPKITFAMAVAMERLGEADEADQILEKLSRTEAPVSCLVDSWGYARWHTRKTPRHLLNLHRGTQDMFRLALDAAMPLIEKGGLICEFGVGSGRSLRMTQEILPLGTPIHGFDTFTGLPVAFGEERAGAYSTGGVIPNMEGEVYIHKGLFGKTIEPFLAKQDPNAPLAYANVDCDLYTSTLDILESMHGRIVSGTVLVFDEYICHPTWRQDEFRAWRECCKRFGWKYEYLGFSLTTQQVVVRLTEA